MHKLKDVFSLPLRVAYMLGIAAALTFGAGALQTVQADHCPDDGYTWLGDCVDDPQCDEMCDDAGGFLGTCRTSGCCICSQ